MWYWTVIFILISLTAASLGFVEIAVGASYIAEIFFAVFTALFVTSRIAPKLKLRMKPIRKN